MNFILQWGRCGLRCFWQFLCQLSDIVPSKRLYDPVKVRPSSPLVLNISEWTLGWRMVSGSTLIPSSIHLSLHPFIPYPSSPHPPTVPLLQKENQIFQAAQGLRAKHHSRSLSTWSTSWFPVLLLLYSSTLIPPSITPQPFILSSSSLHALIASSIHPSFPSYLFPYIPPSFQTLTLIPPSLHPLTVILIYLLHNEA